MTENKRYDPFAGEIRKKLEFHQISVENDWDKIELEIHGKKEEKKAGLWWFCGAAAAAVALLFVTYLAIDHSDHVSFAGNDGSEKDHGQPVQMVGTVSVKQMPDDPPVSPDKPATVTESQMKDKTLSVQQHKPASATIASNDIKTMPEIAGSYDTPVGNQAEQVTGPVIIPDVITGDRDTIQEPDPTHPENGIARPAQQTYPLIDEYPEDNPPAKRKWAVAAAMGYGGSISVDNNRFQSLNEKYSDMSANISSFQNMAPADFSHIESDPPLSFGFLLHRNLKNWGIESGLVYTYLSSRFGWSDGQSFDADQKLHYIGIPVNIVYSFRIGQSPWDIYISGGWMIEKGIRSVYEQKKQSNRETVNTAIKTGIPGVQWSVNGAVGLNYWFGSGFGIYMEPRLSYYFDNDQPVSIRTENPVVLGINAGVKYKFN